MGFDQSIIKELEKFIDSYISNLMSKYGNKVACRDKITHIYHTASISEQLSDDYLTLVATKYHDIGRFPQYELLGNFNDRLVTHNVLGENYIQQLIKENKLPNSKELDAVRLVIQFHGKENLIPTSFQLTPEVFQLVRKVSMIDDLENSCVGVLGYLQRERDEDAKGYKKNNPDLDMKSISPYVLEKFLNGESFDKLIYCKTYADYAIFAATLLIKSLRSENHEFCKAILAKPWHGFSDGINGYYEIFKDMIDNRYLDLCMDTILKYYNYYIPNNEYQLSVNPTSIRRK